MNSILDYFIRSQVILVILYLLYVIILHKRISFGYSRVYLLFIIPLSFVLPFLNIPLNSDTYAGFYEYLPGLFISPEQTPDLPPSLKLFGDRVSFADIFFIIYFTGFLFLNVMLYIRVVSYFKILGKGKGLMINDTKIILSPKSGSAFSLFGKIVIGEYNLDNPGLSHIIKHEKLHCRFFHSVDILFISLQKAMLWFNPVVWHFEKLLRDVHEYQVDEYVVKSGTDAYSYSVLLMDFEMKNSTPYLSNRFSYSTLKDRIRMMGKAGRSRSDYRLLLLLPVIFLCLILFCVTSPGYAGKINGGNGVSPSAGIPETYHFATCPVKPRFRGGDQNVFTQWVFENINYPEKAKSAGIHGRVTLQFTVNEDGTVSDTKVIRSIDETLDREALRVVSKSPRWEPGRDNNGKPVKVRFTFPVIFYLK